MSKSYRLGAVVLLAAFGVASSLPALAPGVDFTFERAYGTYEDVDVEALPVKSGALDVVLSSPDNTVTLEAGSLHLEPAEDGLHKVLLDVTFSGEGQLITVVKLGALPARFEDDVRFPRQQRSVVGWVSIEAVEDGYRVVTRELPEVVQIELESALAGDLVGFCRKMSLFTAGDAGCDSLEGLLSNPKLPLPKPGSEFLVRGSALTETERQRLDLYLEGARLMSALTP